MTTTTTTTTTTTKANAMTMTAAWRMSKPPVTGEELSRDLRDLIAWAFTRRRRSGGTAALRDDEGRNAVCSYPCVLSKGRGFACWQRQPGTGLYRRVTALYWRRGEPRLILGPWQKRGAHDHDHQHNRLQSRRRTT
jgi:hypothetical protein